MSNPETAPYLSVVIPVYNEEECLPDLGRQVSAVMEGLGRPYEVILIDDGSNDASYARIQELARSLAHFKGLRLGRNVGQTAALAAVKRQTTELATLSRTQATLRGLLAQAKAHESTLQRERLAAIARARARAIARAARQHSSSPGPYSGQSGNLSGTVSAATEAAALHDAESQIGKPYQWAAAGPSSYDCSGLVMWAYDQVGVHLDHFTGDQWNEGAHVSRADLQPGDLVFFATNTSDPSTIHHVGLYVGGSEMVDAPYTGVDVRYDSIDRPDYIGAVRPYQR